MIVEAELREIGIISRQTVSIKIKSNEAEGLRFVNKSGKIIEASVKNIYSSQRNTVLGDEDESICLVEHFLAACALMDIDDIDLFVDADELPFGDGSAAFWIEYFRKINLSQSQSLSKKLELKEEFIIFDENDPTRNIKVKPAESFKLSYILDLPNTVVGRQEANWDLASDSIESIAAARTFSTDEENKMLGLDQIVLGYNSKGFTKTLHYPSEPAYHKALDLIGDLRLVGFNPLRLNAHIISSKGGHALNAKLAKYLHELFINI